MVGWVRWFGQWVVTRRVVGGVLLLLKLCFWVDQQRFGQMRMGVCIEGAEILELSSCYTLCSGWWWNCRVLVLRTFIYYSVDSMCRHHQHRILSGVSQSSFWETTLRDEMSWWWVVSECCCCSCLSCLATLAFRLDGCSGMHLGTDEEDKKEILG